MKTFRFQNSEESKNELPMSDTFCVISRQMVLVFVVREIRSKLVDFGKTIINS